MLKNSHNAKKLALSNRLVNGFYSPSFGPQTSLLNEVRERHHSLVASTANRRLGRDTTI